MFVKPVNCSSCGQPSCVVVLDEDCLESVTWIEDNIINHVCPSCKLRQSCTQYPNVCLLHTMPIFYGEYCPACALVQLKSEIGVTNFVNILSEIERR